MNLNHRCFPGSSFRPSPAVQCLRNQVLVITPWNTDVETAQKVMQFFENIYKPLSSDSDSTRPFQQMHSLSPDENNIRTALRQLNEYIFNQYNQEELTLGFEFFLALKTTSEIIFAQVGHPQIYLSRQELSLQPIGPSLTFSTSYSQSSHSLAPLPKTVLGLFPDTTIWIHSLKIHPKDQFILLSRNFIPGNFFTDKQKSLDSLSQILAQDNDSEPFWIGQLQL